jgi:hypothetical protein
MNDTPSTTRGGPSGIPEIKWTAHAALHHVHDGGGLLEELKTLRHGELADLVRYIALLGADEQAKYEIVVSGDHRLKLDEILELYAREDFPHAV